MKEKIQFISPHELYNMLNEETLGVPCIKDMYYMLLLDSRKLEEYSESHIITSRHVPYDPQLGFIFPTDISFSSLQNIVLIDNRASSVNDITSSAVICAERLWNLGSKYPVKVIKGGYEEFSRKYPFLRTHKILYTQREVEDIKLWPYEIEIGFLYMGVFKHAKDESIGKHLQIKGHINVSTKIDPRFSVNDTTIGKNQDVVPQLLQIPVEDDVNVNMLPYFSTACSFIDQHHTNDSKTILVYSDLGISRCVVIVIAYLMNQRKIALKDALQQLLRCHKFICPNRGFIKSLLTWEESLFGHQVTNREDLEFLSYA